MLIAVLGPIKMSVKYNNSMQVLVYINPTFFAFASVAKWNYTPKYLF